MAPEAPQPDFIEKAKLDDTSEHEVDILKDPTKFDEAALRKEFKDKLDAARGNKMITSPVLLKKYAEALKKIDENIASLKEIRDYAVQKAKVKEIGIRIDSFKVDPKNGIHILIMQLDLDTVRNFKKAKLNHILLTMDRQQMEKDVDKIDNKLVAKIDKYYELKLPNWDNAEMDRLRDAPKGEASIVDYDTLDFDLQDKKETLADISKYTSNPDKYLKMAEAQFAKMAEVLALSFPKLSKSDQFVMRNLDAARKAERRGDKNADQWFSGAIELNAMTLAKVRAQKMKEEAVAYGAPTHLLEAGNKLFIQANQISQKSFVMAEKTYKEAGEKYNFVRAIQVAGGAKKKPIDDGTDMKMAKA